MDHYLLGVLHTIRRELGALDSRLTKLDSNRHDSLTVHHLFES